MAVIYLKHEVHGAKVAMDELEALNDISRGWVRFHPEEAKPPIVVTAPIEKVEIEEAIQSSIEKSIEKPKAVSESKKASDHLDQILGKGRR